MGIRCQISVKFYSSAHFDFESVHTLFIRDAHVPWELYWNGIFNISPKPNNAQ